MEPDMSIRNRNALGLFRLISASYDMHPPFAIRRDDIPEGVADRTVIVSRSVRAMSSAGPRGASSGVIGGRASRLRRTRGLQRARGGARGPVPSRSQRLARMAPRRRL